jgi:ATP-dependent RNA helicase DHX36
MTNLQRQWTQCTLWAGRNFGHYLPRTYVPTKRISQVLCRSIFTTGNPSFEIPNYAPGFEKNKFGLEIAQNIGLNTHDGGQRNRESVQSMSPTTTADEFASLMTSEEGHIDGQDALTWFSVVNDSGKFPIRNVSHYSSVKSYPHAMLYPQLPVKLFEKPPSSEAIAWLHRILEAESEVSMVEELVKRPNRYVWRHTLTIDLRTVDITAVGEGASKTDAYSAAFMNALQQLHESNLLHTLSLSALNGPNQSLSSGVENVPHPNTKLHIYNYAARFGLIPQFRSKPLPAGKTEITLSIRELGLQVVVVGRSDSDAELLACAHLKKELEARHAELSEHPLTLRGPDTVNLDNASAILTYFASLHDGNAFNYVVKANNPLNPQSHISSWVTRNGKIFTSPVTMPDRERAQALATLVAATQLVKENHGLLVRFYNALKENNGIILKRSPPIPYTFTAPAEEFLRAWSATVDRMKIPEQSVGPADPSHHLADALNAQMKVSRGRRYATTYHSTQQSLESRSAQLKSKHESRKHDQRFDEEREAISRLPINAYRDELLALIKNNPQCIVVGTSGSGKSTQLPRILLDDAVADGRGAYCNIYHTQPRRATSVELAIRVARGRDEEVGETVGYWISGDRRQCDQGGSISFCTSDILQLQLQHGRDEFLDNVSHIIVDEVHERDGPTNRLLMTLKLAFAARLARGASVPKLILMSATLQSGLFERYFELTNETGESLPPPVITIPGRQFPIVQKYLGDVMQELKGNFSSAELEPVLHHPLTYDYVKSELSTTAVGHPQVAGSIAWESQFEINIKSKEEAQVLGLIATTIAHIVRTTSNGDILVFLTSWRDFEDVQKILRRDKFMDIDFADTDKFKILWLHSANPTSIPEAMEPGSQGCRRILLATNIAETSHTFPEVKFVIDCGKRRAPGYGESALTTSLYRKWISKASVTQRAGRIGRVQPGEYYALFTERRHDSLSPFQTAVAEDHRTIQRLCLNARLHFPSLSIHQYFGRLIDPPPHRNVEAAIKQLESTGAIVEGEALTDLGVTLARLQRPPGSGKMLLLGILFRCLDPLLSICAMVDDSNSVHVQRAHQHDGADPDAVRQFRRRYERGSMSDCITDLNILDDFRHIRDEQGIEVVRQWASTNHMEYDQLVHLDSGAQMCKRMLSDLECINEEDKRDTARLNSRSTNRGLVKALIMVGVYPNVAVHAQHDQFQTNQTLQPARLWTHSATRPTSWQPSFPGENPLRHSLCCYANSKAFEKTRDNAKLYNTTPVSPLALALFCQSLSIKDGDETTLIVDGWIPLKLSGSPNGARTLLKFKQQLDRTLSIALQRLCNPKLRSQGSFHALESMVQTVADLLENDERKWRQRMDKLDRSSDEVCMTV